MVKLLVTPPINSRLLKELEGDLRRTTDISLILIGGTADGGIQIVVSADAPVPLIDILADMPQVENVNGNNDKIHILLK